MPALADHVYESLKPEFPSSAVEISDQRFDYGPLQDFNFNDPSKFHRLTLDQCIENALRNSQVIRELGGTTLRSPEASLTSDDPAITYTDPRVGEEAALSEFDAQFSNNFGFQNNDRTFNSSFIGDQGRLDQKLATNLTGLSKRSATGTLFHLNHQLLYDLNNTPANRFANNVSYDTFLEAGFRRPLLQGGGALFNRIAGPNNLPGVNNGVLIARTNTDITLADFELGIRNLVSEVENAYWDLYFAYRDLEAKIEARNGAYQIWQNVEADADKGVVEKTQAEEQYFLFSSRVKDAIHGQLNDGTRTNNGSTSGTFRGNSGVRTAERRLRLIAGYPVNESVLFVPNDMPVEAKVVFDWEQVKTDALTRRTELRRQRWVLKREELNIVANKNQLLPRLDVVGKYRIRGFGNDLFGSTGFNPLVTPGVDPQNGSDAFATFMDGDLQEWELGMDLNIPIGFRRQLASVRNSELAYFREQKILREQEREIIYGLSNSLGEVERTSSLMEVNAKRLDASKRQYKAIQEEFKSDDTTIDLVLESQRRVIDAKLDYFRTQVEFMLAVKAVHFEKGTVLDYHHVSLSESGWSGGEIRQAVEREKNKTGPIDYYCPGLKVSSPLEQSKLAFGGPESVILARQQAKQRSDMLFANDDEASAEKKTDTKIAENKSSTTKVAKVDSILLDLAGKLRSDRGMPAGSTIKKPDSMSNTNSTIASPPIPMPGRLPHAWTPPKTTNTPLPTGLHFGNTNFQTGGALISPLTPPPANRQATASFTARQNELGITPQAQPMVALGFNDGGAHSIGMSPLLAPIPQPNVSNATTLGPVSSRKSNQVQQVSTPTGSPQWTAVGQPMDSQPTAKLQPASSQGVRSSDSLSGQSISSRR